MPIEAPYLHLRDDDDCSPKTCFSCQEDGVDDDVPVHGDGLFPVATDIQRRKESRKSKEVGKVVSSIPPRSR